MKIFELRINSSKAKKDRMKKKKKEKEKERKKERKWRRARFTGLIWNFKRVRFVSFGVCEILCDFDFWFFKRERGPIRFRFVSYQIGGSFVILFLKNG